MCRVEVFRKFNMMNVIRQNSDFDFSEMSERISFADQTNEDEQKLQYVTFML